MPVSRSMLRSVMTCGIAAGVLAGIGVAGPAGGEARRPAKGALTAANMADLHRLIRPQPDEYRWDQISWYASIWDARKAAAARDKPILVFGTGGAGFNDPLGNC